MRLIVNRMKILTFKTIDKSEKFVSEMTHFSYTIPLAFITELNN